MNIQNLQNYQVFPSRNFKGSVEGTTNGKDFAYGISNLEKSPATDTVEFSNKNKPEEKIKKPSLGKRVAVGTASFFVPGLGQAINGQWGKAAAFFLASTLITLGTFAFAPAALPALQLAAVKAGIINLGSGIDAAKNAKPN